MFQPKDLDKFLYRGDSNRINWYRHANTPGELSQNVAGFHQLIQGSSSHVQNLDIFKRQMYSPINHPHPYPNVIDEDQIHFNRYKKL